MVNGRHSSNWGMLLLLMLAGSIITAYLGELLIAYIPLLSRWGSGTMVGIPAVSVNLAVLKLSFALQLKLNLFTVLGFLAGFLVFRRL